MSDDTLPPDKGFDENAPAVSYETQIKPLFRNKDRTSMLNMFDLWLYDDVKDWADRIYDQLSQGNMPCDNPWPQENIDLFGAWKDGGMAP